MKSDPGAGWVKSWTTQILVTISGRYQSFRRAPSFVFSTPNRDGPPLTPCAPRSISTPGINSPPKLPQHQHHKMPTMRSPCQDQSGSAATFPSRAGRITFALLCDNNQLAPCTGNDVFIVGENEGKYPSYVQRPFSLSSSPACHSIAISVFIGSIRAFLRIGVNATTAERWKGSIRKCHICRAKARHAGQLIGGSESGFDPRIIQRSRRLWASA